MNNHHYPMDPISEEVLQQLKYVETNEINIRDMKKVFRYALQNRLLRLGGWISWNGVHHFDELMVSYLMERNILKVWQPEDKPNRGRPKKKEADGFRVEWLGEDYFGEEEDQTAFIQDYLNG